MTSAEAETEVGARAQVVSGGAEVGSTVLATVEAEVKGPARLARAGVEATAPSMRRLATAVARAEAVTERAATASAPPVA